MFECIFHGEDEQMVQEGECICGGKKEERMLLNMIFRMKRKEMCVCFCAEFMLWAHC